MELKKKHNSRFWILRTAYITLMGNTGLTRYPACLLSLSLSRSLLVFKPVGRMGIAQPRSYPHSRERNTSHWQREKHFVYLYVYPRGWAPLRGGLGQWSRCWSTLKGHEILLLTEWSVCRNDGLETLMMVLNRLRLQLQLHIVVEGTTSQGGVYIAHVWQWHSDNKNRRTRLESVTICFIALRCLFPPYPKKL